MKVQLISLILLLNSFSSYSISQPNWIWQNPVPTGSNLHNIQFTDDQTGYAIGDNFTILKTTNSGEEWNSITMLKDSIPLGLNGNFRAIHFLNSNTGYIGRNGIFKTNDGGDSWSFQITEAPVNSICFVNNDTGYAACDGGKILKTINGGYNWSLHFSIGDISNKFNDIEFISKDTGFVVGWFQTILRTTDAGTTWVLRNGNMGYALYDIDFINNNTGFASGGFGKIAKTTNGGESWFYLPSVNTSELNNIHFISASTGYVVSTFYGSEGRLYKTTDGGNAWQLLFDLGIHISKNNFLQDDEFLISCDGGNIYKTTDAGSSWSNTIQNVSTSTLHSIDFISEQTGFIAGNNVLLKTTNAGMQWQLKFTPGKENYFYTKFFDDNFGYLAGANLYRTHDGGLNWNSITQLDSVAQIQAMNSDTLYFLKNGFLYKTLNAGWNWQKVFIAGNATNFHFFKNNDTGFALNRYSIGFPLSRDHNDLFKTTDNGLSWQLVRTFVLGLSSGFYTSINFVNSHTGFIAGAPGLILTTDGGNNWSYPYNGLYGLSSPVYFYNDKIGYVSNWNKIYKTTNTGVNWIQIFETSNNLNSYFFTGINTGYTIGELGHILKTTNGGGIFVNQPEISESVPLTFTLFQNYPNPFNPETNIVFELPERSKVKLSVYNTLGEIVGIIVNSELNRGSHHYKFSGADLSSGIYFYTLETRNYSQTRKMIILK